MSLPHLEKMLIEARASRQKATESLAAYAVPQFDTDEGRINLGHLMAHLVAASLKEGVILGQRHALEGEYQL